MCCEAIRRSARMAREVDAARARNRRPVDGGDLPQQPRQRDPGLGDYEAARGHYADSLRGYRDYGDSWALAFLLEDIGRSRRSRGDGASALELIGAADAFRDAIGAPRAPSLAEQIERAAPPQTDRPCCERPPPLRARGRTLDLAAAPSSRHSRSATHIAGRARTRAIGTCLSSTASERDALAPFRGQKFAASGDVVTYNIRRPLTFEDAQRIAYP